MMLKKEDFIEGFVVELYLNKSKKWITVTMNSKLLTRVTKAMFEVHPEHFKLYNANKLSNKKEECSSTRLKLIIKNKKND